jgi:hypothetical protein
MMTIHPHKGVDTIRFGMTREEVAAVIGQVPHRARRNQDDASDYDVFRKLGVFVYYDADDKCHAVEFTRDALVTYDGYELFAHPAHEARAWARARDQDLDDKDGFVSTALGLSMYAPSVDEPDLDDDERSEPAQSFLAFRPGYYEQERRRLKGKARQA